MRDRETERDRERGNGRQGAASVGVDQASGECGASEAGAASGTSARTASAQPHGVLQGLQRADAAYQIGRAHVGHGDGLQGQLLRFRGEVPVRILLLEESGGLAVRGWERGPQGRGHRDSQAHLRDRQDQAVGS